MKPNSNVVRLQNLARIGRRRAFSEVMRYKREQLEKWQVTESVDLYFLWRRQEIGKCLKRWLEYVRENPQALTKNGEKGLQEYGTKATNCVQGAISHTHTALCANDTDTNRTGLVNESRR